MPLKHQILAAAYHPLRAANAMLRIVRHRLGGRLRVLLFHDIAPHEEARFATHLRMLARSWRFVSPQRFEAMISGDEPVNEDSLLLTFDDGFASNRDVAENVLNPMGIRALFFVVSGFVGISGEEDSRRFVAQNIHPDMKWEDVPNHWRSMTWDDLAFLLETGHLVGGHTKTHARLSTVTSGDLEDEIVTSADELESTLGAKVDHFAYTFGNLASFSSAALGVGRRRFRFIYTGLRGDNARSIPPCPWAIRRDAIAPADSFALVGAFLEGGSDFLYSGSLAEYESWGSSE